MIARTIAAAVALASVAAPASAGDQAVPAACSEGRVMPTVPHPTTPTKETP